VDCEKVDGSLSMKINRPERELNHLPPKSAQAKNNHLRIFENMVLRKIFGAKWDEVTGRGKTK
jgi:gamma-glutamyl-gamma-aminobutyrate hydrolase PuuD